MEKKYMNIARKEATIGILKKHGGPFGSVIVKNGEIIAKGHNMVLKNNDPTMHGEIVAIKNACKKLNTYDLSGCDIYTTAEPCPMCLGAILWANIDRIYYGCNIVDTEKIGFRDLAFYEKMENPKELMTEVSREECIKLFEKYNNLTDKKQY